MRGFDLNKFYFRYSFFILLQFQNTALHLASKNGHELAVDYLLEKQAKFLTNSYQENFMDMAIENRQCSVLSIVIENRRYFIGQI